MFLNIKETRLCLFSLTHCCVKCLKYKQDYNTLVVPHGHNKVFFSICYQNFVATIYPAVALLTSVYLQVATIKKLLLKNDMNLWSLFFLSVHFLCFCFIIFFSYCCSSFVPFWSYFHVFRLVFHDTDAILFMEWNACVSSWI